MFTGLIGAVGTIGKVDRSGKTTFSIDAHDLIGDGMEPLALGESIAVNGVCLTVERVTGSGFAASVMPITLLRTNLGLLRPGARVNLERALTLSGRLGGHLVSGHVDGMGRVTGVEAASGARLVTVVVPDAVGTELVPRGSVTLDGVSLTVAELHETPGNIRFTVSLVGHTQGATTLSGLVPGSVVNIETDILMKYVRKAVGTGNPKSSGLTLEGLAGLGYGGG